MNKQGLDRPAPAQLETRIKPDKWVSISAVPHPWVQPTTDRAALTAVLTERNSICKWACAVQICAAEVGCSRCCCWAPQPCPPLCGPVDRGPPGLSAHGLPRQDTRGGRHFLLRNYVYNFKKKKKDKILRNKVYN